MPSDREFVVLPRDALFEFFGQVALPPGACHPLDADCAPIASRIISWVEGHDLAGLDSATSEGYYNRGFRDGIAEAVTEERQRILEEIGKQGDRISVQTSWVRAIVNGTEG